MQAVTDPELHALIAEQLPPGAAVQNPDGNYSYGTPVPQRMAPVSAV